MKILQIIGEAYIKLMDWLSGSSNDAAAIKSRRVFGVQVGSASVGAAVAASTGVAGTAVLPEEVGIAVAAINRFCSSGVEMMPRIRWKSFPELEDTFRISDYQLNLSVSGSLKSNIEFWDTKKEDSKNAYLELMSNLDVLPHGKKIQDYLGYGNDSNLSVICQVFRMKIPQQDMTVGQFIDELPTQDGLLKRLEQIILQEANDLKELRAKVLHYIQPLNNAGVSIPKKVIKLIEKLPSSDDPNFDEANAKLQQTIDEALNAAAKENEKLQQPIDKASPPAEKQSTTASTNTTETTETKTLFGFKLFYQSSTDKFTFEANDGFLLPDDVFRSFGRVYKFLFNTSDHGVVFEDGSYKIAARELKNLESLVPFIQREFDKEYSPYGANLSLALDIFRRIAKSQERNKVDEVEQ